MDTNLNKRVQTGLSRQRDDIKSSINNMINNPVDEFNINNAFLMMVAETLENWRLVNTFGINGKKDCPDYYNQLITFLEVLLDFLSAKLTQKEEEQQSKAIEDYYYKVDYIFQSDYRGNMLMDRKRGRELRLELGRKFRELLRLMELKGLLTKKNADPRLAMADIE